MVGLLASVDKSYLYLPESGEEQTVGVMRSLALVKPGGEVPVDTLLTSQEERFDFGSAVIVITSSDIKRMGGAAAPYRETRHYRNRHPVRCYQFRRQNKRG